MIIETGSTGLNATSYGYALSPDWKFPFFTSGFFTFVVLLRFTHVNTWTTKARHAFVCSPITLSTQINLSLKFFRQVKLAIIVSWLIVCATKWNITKSTVERSVYLIKKSGIFEEKKPTNIFAEDEKKKIRCGWFWLAANIWNSDENCTHFIRFEAAMTTFVFVCFNPRAREFQTWKRGQLRTRLYTHTTYERKPMKLMYNNKGKWRKEMCENFDKEFFLINSNNQQLNPIKSNSLRFVRICEVKKNK